MLAKIHRLKRAKDFARVWHGRQGTRGPLFDLKAAANGLTDCRFAFLIGLKVSKKATIRNRARRQVTEALRLLWGKLKPGYDIILISKPRLVGQKRELIVKELEEILKKNDLII